MDGQSRALIVIGSRDKARKGNFARDLAMPLQQRLGQFGNRVIVDFSLERTRRCPVGGQNGRHADGLHFLLRNAAARESEFCDRSGTSSSTTCLRKLSNVDGEDRRRFL